MGLNIKNDETQRLSRELAGETGETITTAITVAVRERLERLHAGTGTSLDAARRERLQQIADDAAGRWAGDVGEHGDLLYDERGLPR